MTRKTRSEKRVGKTEDQLGLPHARMISDGAVAEVRAIIKADQDLEQLRKVAETVPDSIIRAYRKAIRARVALNANVNIRDVDGWIYGVISELAQLYPDLNKLPKEEFGYSANPDPDLDIEVEVSGMPKPKHTRMTTLKVESRGRAKFESGPLL